MPTYDYKCEKCSHTMEAFQKITEDALTVCPKCKNESLHRVPSKGVGLSFKGSGFYGTDYGPLKPPASETGGSCCPCGKNKKSCS